MKKWLFLLGFIIPLTVLSQSELTDELRYSRDAKAVFQGTRKMSMDDLFVRMRPYPKAFKLIESARDCNFYSTIFFTAGAIPLGFVLVDKLVYNRTNWHVFATGIGLIAVAIPLNIRYKKQLQRSVVSFNREVESSAQIKSNFSLSLAINANTLGLKLRF